jgi:hypothetical protein
VRQKKRIALRAVKAAERTKNKLVVPLQMQRERQDGRAQEEEKDAPKDVKLATVAVQTEPAKNCPLQLLPLDGSLSKSAVEQQVKMLEVAHQVGQTLLQRYTIYHKALCERAEMQARLRRAEKQVAEQDERLIEQTRQYQKVIGSVADNWDDTLFEREPQQSPAFPNYGETAQSILSGFQREADERSALRAGGTHLK